MPQLPRRAPPRLRNDNDTRRHGSTQAARQEAAANHRFPLHLVVFKQVSSHIPHEANVEQYFSRAVCALGLKIVASMHTLLFAPLQARSLGSRSVACSRERSFVHLRACSLIRTWTRSTSACSSWWASTRKVQALSVTAIKERYYQLFRGKGGEQ